MHVAAPAVAIARLALLNCFQRFGYYLLSGFRSAYRTISYVFGTGTEQIVFIFFFYGFIKIGRASCRERV